MFLILFVLNDPDQVRPVLDAWEEAGVTGVTILHSSGLGRVRMHSGLRDDLPLMPSLESLMQHDEYFSRTLFSVVDEEKLVDRVVKATQQVVGDLMRPNTGLLMVLPILQVYGLQKHQF